MKRALVTGGAGFIGSHLVDRLIKDHEVIVLDDLSGGSLDNLKHHSEKRNFKFIRGSITNSNDIKIAIEGVDIIYHFAAQADVKLSVEDPVFDFEVNVIGGMNLLEAMRLNDISDIIFASSGGTVYGEPEILPTPEKTPLDPISNYGAAKCAVEMYLSSYSHLYGFRAISLRLANIFGPRLTRGVIFDFYQKLKRNPKTLEILGNGKQRKAYMYIDDTVDAIQLLSRNLKHKHQPINISSGECMSVNKIAEIVIDALGLKDVRIEYTGGKCGWSGDVPVTDVDISVLRTYGWQPSTSLKDQMTDYVKWLDRVYISI